MEGRPLTPQKILLGLGFGGLGRGRAGAPRQGLNSLDCSRVLLRQDAGHVVGKRAAGSPCEEFEMPVAPDVQVKLTPESVVGLGRDVQSGAGQGVVHVARAPLEYVKFR